MKILAYFALLVVVSARYTHPVDKLGLIIDVGETEFINDLVDEMLPAISEHIVQNGLDPLTAPDLRDGFSVKPLLITYHGELFLHDGVIFNMQSVSRSGDAVRATLNGLYRVRIPVAFNYLTINYEYLAQVMSIGPTGGVKASISQIKVIVDIMYDSSNAEYHIQEFSVDQVGKIQVRLTGNFLTDWFVNPVVAVITTLFKTTVVQAVEDAARNVLQQHLDALNAGHKQTQN